MAPPAKGPCYQEPRSRGVWLLLSRSHQLELSLPLFNQYLSARHNHRMVLQGGLVFRPITSKQDSSNSPPRTLTIRRTRPPEGEVVELGEGWVACHLGAGPKAGIRT